MQLFGCCNPLKDKLSGGFTVKYYLTKKAMQQKVTLPFSNAFTHTNQKVAFVSRAPLSVETPARMPKFATLTPW